MLGKLWADGKSALSVDARVLFGPFLSVEVDFMYLGGFQRSVAFCKRCKVYVKALESSTGHLRI